MRTLSFLIWVFIPGLLLSQATITVDNSIAYQTIDGFGGFGPKKVWWSSSPYYDQQYIDLIVDDLGASIIRTQLYWDFEESNDNGDPYDINWSGFNFGSGSNNGKQFPFMIDLAAKGDIKQIVSLWTPPIWMKEFKDRNDIPNECYNCHTCDMSVYPPQNGAKMCGGNLNMRQLDEFAEYCVAYIKKVKEETGVDMYGLSLQNELRFANPFESCVYTPEEMAQALEVVGDRFEEESLTTYFYGPEDMGQSAQNAAWVNAILRDNPVSREHMDIWAVHGYQDGVAADYGNAPGWEAINDQVRAYGKRLWMTETSDGDNSGWSLAFNMTRALHLALKHGKINAWVYWYMTGAMLNNSNSPTPLFYTFKHYYKNIRPGSVMIDCQSDDADVLCSAFKDGNNQRLTIVLINNSGGTKTVSLDLAGYSLPSSFSWISTTDGNNYADQGSISNNTFDLPANSVNTLIFEGSNYSPTIDPVEFTVAVGSDGEHSIPLTGITDGGDGGQNINVSAQSSNPTLTGTPTIQYTSPGNTGTLQFTPQTGQTGIATISVILSDNGNEYGGLHERTMNFTVKVIPFLNVPPSVDSIRDLNIYLDDGQQIITLPNLHDGNDGSQAISTDIETAVPQALQVASVVKDNTLQLYFVPKLKGNIPVTLTLKDNGGTDLEGVDAKEYTFNINILEGTAPDPDPQNVNEHGEEQFMLYPNPVSNYLNIKSSSINFSAVKICDLTGRVLFNEHFEPVDSKTIELSSLVSGTYFVQVLKDNNILCTKKLMLQ